MWAFLYVRLQFQPFILALLTSALMINKLTRRFDGIFLLLVFSDETSQNISSVLCRSYG